MPDPRPASAKIDLPLVSLHRPDRDRKTMKVDVIIVASGRLAARAIRLAQLGRETAEERPQRFGLKLLTCICTGHWARRMIHR